MGDSFWMNVRYALIALGVGLLVKYFNINTETAEGFVTPIVGAAIAFLTAMWGNYVRSGTATVPVSEAKRPDVETVSPATGKIEAGNIYR
jgi:multidrug efflux pump subunit AcrA (membrane-fusion protein)